MSKVTNHLASRLALALLAGLATAGFFQGGSGARGPGATVEASTAAPAITLRDIEYARAGDKSLKLDLHLPAGDGPFPVIVWIHGGGWTSGDKELSAAGAQLRQTARGYAVASINYRLSHEAKFPAQIEDCKAAVRWLRANASEHKLDPDRIAAWGSSAGGHLAALLGVSAGADGLEGDGGNLEYSSRVLAVVDWFGPVDLLKMNADSLGFPCNLIDHNSPLSPESLLIGCAIQTCAEKAARANPITYASADDAAFLIMHGTDDCLVGPTQSQRLQNALRAAGVEASLKFIEGAGHGGSEFERAENRNLLDEFLDKHLSSQAEPVKITAASVSGKKLFVFGENFSTGAAVLLDGRKQKTSNDEQNPTTALTAKKAGKKISRGQTVTLEVRNSDGRLSEPFIFTRPQ
ncbi:MAG TPA: alpha/beta hydrolase [Blastocatellia bacterium]|nr:alpha/beta hydrolase [Blastocatellia bacterium]